MNKNIQGTLYMKSKPLLEQGNLEGNLEKPLAVNLKKSSCMVLHFMFYVDNWLLGSTALMTPEKKCIWLLDWTFSLHYSGMEACESQAENLTEQLANVLRERLAHLKSALGFAQKSGLQCCLWPHLSSFSWQPQYGNLVRCGVEKNSSLIDNNQCVCKLRCDTNMNKTAAP